jgi:hypothetical protein
MGLLSRLFGVKIDPEALALGLFAAVPFSYATFGRRICVRTFYSPHRDHLFDVPACHQAYIRCRELDQKPPPGLSRFWADGLHRFSPLCRPLGPGFAKGFPIWVRDFYFPKADLAPFLADNAYHPLWLVDRGGPEGHLRSPLPLTARGRAEQRIQYARERKARPVRVALVQANSALFAPGEDDQPCLVLFSFDDRVTDDELTRLARRVFSLKNTAQDDPDLAFVAELTTDERFVYYRRDRLPRSFAGGREFFVAHLYVHRPFLIGGYFHGNRFMTCLAEPGDRGALELLPADGS